MAASGLERLIPVPGPPVLARNRCHLRRHLFQRRHLAEQNDRVLRGNSNSWFITTCADLRIHRLSAYVIYELFRTNAEQKSQIIAIWDSRIISEVADSQPNIIVVVSRYRQIGVGLRSEKQFLTAASRCRLDISLRNFRRKNIGPKVHTELSNNLTCETDF